MLLFRQQEGIQPVKLLIVHLWEICPTVV